jgi:hypothetical protein
MVDLKLRNVDAAFATATNAAGAGLDDATAMALLAAGDAQSVAQLAAWLKTHARTFSPIVAEAIEDEPGLSPEAACAVLDALVWRTPADAETTQRLLEACLSVMARRITESVVSGAPGTLNDRDDALVGSAVAVLTSSRPSRHSEAAIDCLGEAGPGGALVLARAFDGVRDGFKLHIVRRLNPADVLKLGDNVRASLAHSVSRLSEELESPQREVASQFLAELGPVQQMGSSEIGTHEPLASGDIVFHASWGAGVVVTANDETATIDFGGAGTRTLLRALATLRHAG